MPWLELRIPPPLVGLVFAGAMRAVSYAVPALSFTVPGKSGVALTFAALGAVVALAGVSAFRLERTTVNPLNPSASSSIVSRGIYRFSRNPQYLGILLALTGWAVYVSNAAAALLLPVFVAYLTRYQIRPEERVLLAKFGSPFEQYLSRVRRWI